MTAFAEVRPSTIMYMRDGYMPYRRRNGHVVGLCATTTLVISRARTEGEVTYQQTDPTRHGAPIHPPPTDGSELIYN